MYIISICSFFRIVIFAFSQAPILSLSLSLHPMSHFLLFVTVWCSFNSPFHYWKMLSFPFWLCFIPFIISLCLQTLPFVHSVYTEMQTQTQTAQFCLAFVKLCMTKLLNVWLLEHGHGAITVTSTIKYNRIFRSFWQLKF